MKIYFQAALSLVGLLSLSCSAVQAQDWTESQADPGVMGRSGYATNMMGRADSNPTSNQTPALSRGLPQAGFGNMTPILGPRGRNGLPPTSSDSFVLNAGGNAFAIFGNEGRAGLPPLNEYEPGSRIEAGIQGARAAGLTTGRGSVLPSAGGGDEFVKSEPFSQAGGNGGTPANWMDAQRLIGTNRADMDASRGANGSNGTSSSSQGGYDIP